MNSLERVTLALQHKEPDHVPVYPMINSVSRKSLGISYSEWSQDEDKCAEAILKTTEEIGVDVLCTLVDLSVEAADWGQELEYGDEIAAHPNMSKRLITCEKDYAKIDLIHPRKTPRMSGHIHLADRLYQAKGKEMPVVGFVFGPLGILSMMRGQVEMFMDMVKCPKALHPALQAITESLKEFIDGLVEAGCAAIMFDTLYASRTILSAKMWQDFEGSYIEELSNYVREKGAMVMLHNCGDGIYFKEQMERMDPVLISFDHLPPDCKDRAELKSKYGDKVTLMGQVEPGFLNACTDEELRQECRDEIDAYAKDGGFILATGCEYPAPLDFHCAKIMVEEACTYGKY
ncbi:MAG: uroporphyrinogen decarboxylase family protein [Anaerovoracaceae bacterium]|jgi:uroporphyrinogen decarboxylase